MCRYLAYNQSSDFKIQEKPSVWVKDATHGFVRGEVQGQEGAGKIKVKFGDGSVSAQQLPLVLHPDSLLLL